MGPSSAAPAASAAPPPARPPAIAPVRDVLRDLGTGSLSAGSAVAGVLAVVLGEAVPPFEPRLELQLRESVASRRP